MCLLCLLWEINGELKDSPRPEQGEMGLEEEQGLGEAGL